MEYDSFDAILFHIFRSTQNAAWFKPSEENISAGVCLRVDTGNFRVFPYDNPYLAPFEAAVRSLNPLVAVKVRSAGVHSALATVPEDAVAIHIDENTRLQILDTVASLPTADKEQCGAFLRDERVLIVWSDDLDQIVPLCNEFEEKMMKLVLKARHTPSVSTSTSVSGSSVPSTTPSKINLVSTSEKEVVTPPSITVAEVTAAAEALAAKESAAKTTTPSPRRKFFGLGWRVSSKSSTPEQSDPEKATVPAPRPVRLFAPLYTGLGLGLSLFFIACGVNILLVEWKLDHDFTRFALLATAPFLVCVSLFFSIQIITSIAMIVGPIAQAHENSKYYSAIRPGPSDIDSRLPHITIEMPVYKESLQDTISPSVFSLKRAMQSYARQGGTSSIFIHDDGLQTLSEKDREERINFYADHNIGWIARPPHSSDPEGYKRAGRFKKASNMNYGLQLSLIMEKHILTLEAQGETDDYDGSCLEDKALEMAIDEVYENSGKRWKPWAKNARSLRIGEHILIVDSDTIVPEDCLRDAARELYESPEVAIIQHESDVLQVAHHFFENGIAHFTRRINKCISLACANGDVAPFVGHNAFLRWSALQEVAFVDTDGVKKIWSESNVSEDFDMALRLQLNGYTIRWANYTQGGFKEGVSLTVDDELNRWQKYSYGCSELLFNPVAEWWRKGPVTKQIRTFLWSGAPVHYKLSMMSYMFSYYGLAAGAFLSLMNYLILGLAPGVDGFYLHSFEIFLACMVVFPGAGNAAFTIFEYRLGQKDLFSAFFENVMWIPFFWFFFGGLSIHLSTAILAHMFSYNMVWGATKKEVERSNFWLEGPRILKRYWLAFAFSFASLAGIAILSTEFVPLAWRIPASAWGLFVPLITVAVGHILFPIVLNPWLMIFSY